MNGFADQGALPLAGLLGPTALRPRAHVDEPPLSLALRGGSRLYGPCKTVDPGARRISWWQLGALLEHDGIRFDVS
jgi:hypothetical protein